jgi:hypothetical protein
MVNHPKRSSHPRWDTTARMRINQSRIAVGSDLHLLEMALKERGELIAALQGVLAMSVSGTKFSEWECPALDAARTALDNAGVKG